jgi:prepilin-type N-terminal cleavage/methylation domain-containing protein
VRAWRSSPCGEPERNAATAAGFTLVELLVVIAILAVLAALLLPVLASAKNGGHKVRCLSNLRQVGIALQSYADDHAGRIPYGPKAPPFTSPASFYPSTGAPTSLLSLQSGAPVGLGLLLESYLAREPKVLFCPGADQPLDADAELAKVGRFQAQSSYYYRHGGNTELFDSPAGPEPPASLRLDNPGLNRDGVSIRVLALDTQFLAPPDLAAFNVKSRTHHRLQFANLLRTDGSVTARSNRDGRFTVDLREYGDIRDAFSRILKVLEAGDREL